jgi:hypothetical protein
MSRPVNHSARTSNDLLRELIARHANDPLNYQIVAQSAEDVQNLEDAPAVSMAPYLIESGQTRLLSTVIV